MNMLTTAVKMGTGTEPKTNATATTADGGINGDDTPDGENYVQGNMINGDMAALLW